MVEKVNSSTSQTTAKTKRSVPSLEKLLQDRDVAEMFQLIHEYNLRDKAVAILSERIDNLKKLESKETTH